MIAMIRSYQLPTEGLDLENRFCAAAKKAARAESSEFQVSVFKPLHRCPYDHQ